MVTGLTFPTEGNPIRATLASPLFMTCRDKIVVIERPEWAIHRSPRPSGQSWWSAPTVVPYIWPVWPSAHPNGIRWLSNTLLVINRTTICGKPLFFWVLEISLSISLIRSRIPIFVILLAHLRPNWFNKIILTNYKPTNYYLTEWSHVNTNVSIAQHMWHWLGFYAAEGWLW